MSLAQATQTRVDHPSATLKGDKRAALRSAPMRAHASGPPIASVGHAAAGVAVRRAGRRHSIVVCRDSTDRTAGSRSTADRGSRRPRRRARARGSALGAMHGRSRPWTARRHGLGCGFGRPAGAIQSRASACGRRPTRSAQCGGRAYQTQGLRAGSASDVLSGTERCSPHARAANMRRPQARDLKPVRKEQSSRSAVGHSSGT